MTACLEITPVLYCPNRCRYCPQRLAVQNYEAGQTRVLSRADFTRYMESVPRDLLIQFNGAGEPFCNPVVTDMILDRVREGHPVSLYTTLIGSKEEDMDRLWPVQFTSFCAHLPDSEGLSEMPGTFNARYKSVLKLIVRRPMSNQRLVVHGGGIRPDLASIAPNPERQIIRPFAGLNPYLPPRGDHDWTICKASDNKFDHNIMMPNGDVYICCHDFGLTQCIGNLGRDKWPDLNRGPIPLCRKCEFAI